MWETRAAATAFTDSSGRIPNAVHERLKLHLGVEHHAGPSLKWLITYHNVTQGHLKVGSSRNFIVHGGGGESQVATMVRCNIQKA